MNIGHFAIACALVVGLGVGTASARTIGLTKDGRSEYTIVLSASATPSEKHAASELQSFVKRVSGAELPIVTEGGPAPKRMIVIGDGETLRALRVKIDFKDLGDEGFAIRTAGPHLVIAGGRLRGTMYGVYGFLEEVLGCRWYTPHVSYIPKMPSIEFKRPLSIVEKPDFEYREPYYTGAFDADWAARNRNNGNSAGLDEPRGGKVTYHHFVHSFADLVPVEKYWATHPEYYSLIDGKRTHEYAQLCLTNPDVLKIATATVMRWIEERPDATIFSVSQNDCYNNCHCDNCRAVDKEEGSPSGLVLRFVNAIADEVAKKHPGKLIDTLAYQWTEKSPKITKPHENVRVRLCPIFACEFHSYEACPKDTGFVLNLQGWSKVTSNLYIWHYTTAFANYLVPFPDLDQLATSIPMYKRYGVKGIFAEGTYTAGDGPYGGGGFMDDLKQYLIAKLLWNSKADAKAITHDFLDGYFGKAGRPIGEFLDLLHQKVEKDQIHGTCLDQWPSATFLTPEVMTRSNQIFDEAEKLADNAEILRRVKHARLSIEFVENASRASKAADSGSREEKASALKSLQSFIDRCEADGITQFAEGVPTRPLFDPLVTALGK